MGLSGVTRSDFSGSQSAFSFSLTCMVGDGTPSTGNVRLQLAPSITINPSTITIHQTPFTLSIGEAATDDIQLELVNVAIGDVTCTDNSLATTTSGTSVTVDTLASGSSISFNLSCEAGDAVVGDEKRITVRNAPPSFIDVQTINVPIPFTGIDPHLLPIGDGQFDVVAIVFEGRLSNADINDLTCASFDNDLDLVDVYDRTVELLLPGTDYTGENSRTQFTMDCTLFNPFFQDSAVIILEFGPAIFIDTTAIVIHESGDTLTIGSEPTDDIVLRFANVNPRAVTCSTTSSSIDITNNVVTANVAASQEHTFTLSCTDETTIGTQEILINNVPSVVVDDQTIEISSTSTQLILTAGPLSANPDILVEYPGVDPADYTCRISDDGGLSINEPSQRNTFFIDFFLSNFPGSGGSATFDIRCSNDAGTISDSATITLLSTLPEVIPTINIEDQTIRQNALKSRFVVGDTQDADIQITLENAVGDITCTVDSNPNYRIDANGKDVARARIIAAGTSVDVVLSCTATSSSGSYCN